MKRHVILHPILFALFPVLFLFQYNRAHAVPLEQAATLMLVSCAVSSTVWLVTFVFLRDPGRSALVASFVTILALSYGHVTLATNEILGRFGTLRLHADSPLFILPWMAALILGCRALARTRSRLQETTAILNVVGGSLVVLSLVGLALASAGMPAYPLGETEELPFVEVEAGERPNIYYIVPDMYANPHTLREDFGHDPDAFVSSLSDLGFHVVEETRANYPRTFLSLASTLNMRYLDDFPELVGTDSRDERLPYRVIADNAVVRFLKSQGYAYVHFNSGWIGTEWSPHADETVDCGTSSEFERMFYRTTILSLFDPHHDGHRRRVDCQFDALAELPLRPLTGEAPVFTFVHLVTPHPPYVFNATGARVDEFDRISDAADPLEERKRLYEEQLRYVNARLLEAVEAILEGEERPPIIIIQSDHGTDLLGDWEDPSDVFIQDRLRNFRAVFAPRAEDPGLLGPGTSVNTFRALFNALFGAEYEQLEDRVYFSRPSAPYRFTEVTELTAFG